MIRGIVTCLFAFEILLCAAKGTSAENDKVVTTTEIRGHIFGLSLKELSEVLVLLNGGMMVARVDMRGCYYFPNVPAGRYVIAVTHPKKFFDEVLVRVRKSNRQFYIYPTLHSSYIKRKEVFLGKLYHKPQTDHDTYYGDFNIWTYMFKPHFCLSFVFMFVCSLPIVQSYRTYSNARVGRRLWDHYQREVKGRPKLTDSEYLKVLQDSYVISTDTCKCNGVDASHERTDSNAMCREAETDFETPFMKALAAAAINWATPYNWKTL